MILSSIGYWELKYLLEYLTIINTVHLEPLTPIQSISSVFIGFLAQNSLAYSILCFYVGVFVRYLLQLVGDQPTKQTSSLGDILLSALKYPPILFSVTTAFFILCVERDSSFAKIYFNYAFFAFAVGLFSIDSLIKIIQVFFVSFKDKWRGELNNDIQKNNDIRHNISATSSWGYTDWFNWLSADASVDISKDLLGHRGYQTRINDQFNSNVDIRAVLISGAYGVGKTTVATMVMAHRDIGKNWLRCEFKSWGRGVKNKPGSLLTVLLDDIFDTLTQKVSTSALRKLPQEIVTALQGYDGTKWTSFFLQKETQIDVIVDHWLSIMAASDTFMWVLIEDLDRRLDPHDDIQSLLPFFDILMRNKNAKHLRFIFTLDDHKVQLSSSLRIPYFRVDMLPSNIWISNVKNIIDDFLSFCHLKLSQYSYCNSNFESIFNGKMSPISIGKRDSTHFLYFREIVTESLIELLLYPRILKQVLRETAELIVDDKSALHGEVLPEDLLFFHTLKYSCPYVFNKLCKKEERNDALKKFNEEIDRLRNSGKFFPEKNLYKQALLEYSYLDDNLKISGVDSIGGVAIFFYLLKDWDNLCLLYSTRYKLRPIHSWDEPEYYIQLMMSAFVSDVGTNL